MWFFVLTRKTTDEAKMKIVLPKTPPILDNWYKKVSATPVFMRVSDVLQLVKLKMRFWFSEIQRNTCVHRCFTKSREEFYKESGRL